MKSNAGFTLIEIMVAIVLLAIISIPLMGFFGNSFSFIKQTDTRQVALLIAQQTLENYKQTDFADLPETSAGSPITTTVTKNDYPAFIKKVDLHTVSTGLKEVIITINWNIKGHQRDLSLKSRIARR